MTLCGCGITLRNPAEAATHRKTCGQPQVKIGDVRKLDTGLDFCLAVGYVRVDKGTGRRRMLSAAR